MSTRPEIAITRSHREIISQRAIMSHCYQVKTARRKTRLLRNYYCASVGSLDDENIQMLVSIGWMRLGPKINDGREYYAYVTEAGAKEIGLEWIPSND